MMYNIQTPHLSKHTMLSALVFFLRSDHEGLAPGERSHQVYGVFFDFTNKNEWYQNMVI